MEDNGTCSIAHIDIVLVNIEHLCIVELQNALAFFLLCLESSNVFADGHLLHLNDGLCREPIVARHGDGSRTKGDSRNDAILSDKCHMIVARRIGKRVVGVFGHGLYLQLAVHAQSNDKAIGGFKFAQDVSVFNVESNHSRCFLDVLQTPLCLLASPSFQIGWRSGIVECRYPT